MAVDLDDISPCPLGVRCESCGVERDDLAVCTVAFAGSASPAHAVPALRRLGRRATGRRSAPRCGS